MTNLDESFMRKALLLAKKASSVGEIPIGALIVLGDKVLAKGYNQVEMLKDATAHAEMLAISSASSVVENWRLSEATLYCTLEPCVMCAGAMFLSRIKRLVYGAPDLRHGACGHFVNLFALKHPTHTIEVTAGILEEECALLMKEFFYEKRKK